MGFRKRCHTPPLAVEFAVQIGKLPADDHEQLASAGFEAVQRIAGGAIDAPVMRKRAVLIGAKAAISMVNQ